MCGILGIWGAPASLASAVVLAQAEKLRHRGPDGLGNAFRNGCGVCHTRLSIIDPSSGDQPFATKDGSVLLVANAAVYNHVELRQELKRKKGVCFESKNDCEVLLHAYLQWDTACFGRIDGFFAIVILDFRGRDPGDLPRLVVARDAIGVTSLYLAIARVVETASATSPGVSKQSSSPFLLVSSELKSTSSSAIGSSTSALVTEAVASFPPGHFLCCDEAGPQTFQHLSEGGMPDIRRIVEASRSLCSSFKLHRWFQPSWYDGNSLPQWMDDIDLKSLRASVCAAVRKRLMSDVPLGLLLSGGLDSSLVCLAAAEYLDELNNELAPPLHIAVGTAHPIARGNLTDSSGRLRTYTVGLTTKEGVVSEDVLVARRVSAHLNTAHTEVLFTAEEGIAAIRKCIYHIETFDVSTVRSSVPLFLLSQRIHRDGVKVLLTGEGSDEIFGGYQYLSDAPSASAFHEECVSLVRNVNLTDLTRVNKTPLAHSIEVRAPFSDKDLMEVAFSIHPGYKVFLRERTASLPEGWLRLEWLDDIKDTIRPEKAVLRAAFDPSVNTETPDGARTLFPEVLWRKKQQFSDGVGSSWARHLREHASRTVSRAQLRQAALNTAHLAPRTPEELVYRQHFQDLFGTDGHPEQTVVRWQAGVRFGRGGDPSGFEQ